jgi:glyoxylate utilization-related uncharacterized protein
MPSASQDELPLKEIVPGYSSRMADWGGITVAFEKAGSGQDASSMVKGLPDDRCQAPHWGYLLSGRMTVEVGGEVETIEAGQAYYIRPGHKLTFETDCEALEFTPTEALERALEAVRRNHAARESGAEPSAPE